MGGEISKDHVNEELGPRMRLGQTRSLALPSLAGGLFEIDPFR
jgi:hypothetical protein